jgi:hypothetical protein
MGPDGELALKTALAVLWKLIRSTACDAFPDPTD